MFSLVVLTALAFPMDAVDGVLFISQNSALAGNVTPGDAPGFPVTISVSGSYRLSRREGQGISVDCHSAVISNTAVFNVGIGIFIGGGVVSSCEGS